MLGFKPNVEIWERVNKVIFDENAAVVMVTFISGMCALLVKAKVCRDEQHARVHLAAMLLSPDDDEEPGSLASHLPAEFSRLRDGNWLQ